MLKKEILLLADKIEIECVDIFRARHSRSYGKTGYKLYITFTLRRNAIKAIIKRALIEQGRE